MQTKKIKWLGVGIVLLVLLFSSYFLSEPLTVIAQQPTGSIPTVTGTPPGPVASVRIGLSEDRVNVRSGPSVLYPQIGVILLGAKVPVVGKSAGGDWLVVEYAGVPGGIGWVWSLYMDVTPGELAIIENPPPPKPATTVTIDPTMAAQFITTPLATNLPTFTAPAPLSIPSYEVSTGQTLANIPIGLVILVLAGLGVVIGMFSIFQSR